MEAEVKRLIRRASPREGDLRPKRNGDSTLVYPFDPELAWMAVTHLRTASRALWALYSSGSMRLEPLYEELVDWVATDNRGWLKDGFGISVYAKDVEAFPAGVLQIQGTVKNAIIEGASRRGMIVHLDADKPDVVISARGTPPQISIDLAGGSLHQRGWRLDRGEAPLRENVAAQMLMLSRWDPRSEPLVDPMAGSGTIAIEAALMARGAPLAADKSLPLAARLPAFKDMVAPIDLFPGTPPPIVAHERHTPDLDRIKSNAQRAGASIGVLHGDFRELSQARLAEALGGAPSDHGLVIVNPPYGIRVGGGGDDAELDALYEDLKTWVLSLGPGWRIAMLALPDRVERVFGSGYTLKKPMPNGGLTTYFYVFSQQS